MFEEDTLGFPLFHIYDWLPVYNQGISSAQPTSNKKETQKNQVNSKYINISAMNSPFNNIYFIGARNSSAHIKAAT